MKRQFYLKFLSKLKNIRKGDMLSVWYLLDNGRIETFEGIAKNHYNGLEKFISIQNSNKGCCLNFIPNSPRLVLLNLQKNT